MQNRDSNDSEIFDLYAEALEKADADWRESPEIKKYKSETNPRMDSQSIKDIELFYEKPKDLPYKNNIIEQAHPEMCVISPAYDKINGLVENLNEAQSINIYNVQKGSPWGGPTQHKLAKQDLILELVSIANHMDALDNANLQSLADLCIADLSKQALKKEALWPGAIIIGLSLAAILGYSIYVNKSLPSDQGVKNNCEKAIEEIEDLTENHEWTQWLHQNVNESTRQELSDLKYKLQDLKQITEEYNNLDSSFTLKKVGDLSKLKDPGTLNSFKANAKVVQTYLTKIQETLPLISSCLDGLKWSAEHPNAEEDSAWWSTLKKLWRSVSSDDISDATRYLTTLQESCKKALQEALSIRKWSESKALEIEGETKAFSPEDLKTKQPQKSTEIPAIKEPMSQPQKPTFEEPLIPVV